MIHTALAVNVCKKRNIIDLYKNILICRQCLNPHSLNDIKTGNHTNAIIAGCSKKTGIQKGISLLGKQ